MFMFNQGGMLLDVEDGIQARVFPDDEQGRREEAAYGLERRWRYCIRDTWEHEFEIEGFRPLLKDSFAYFRPYAGLDALPKDAVGVLLVMFEFSNIAELCSDEVEDAKSIVLDLCHQIVGPWRKHDGEISDTHLVLGDGTAIDMSAAKPSSCFEYSSKDWV